MQLHELTASTIVAGYRGGQFSPVEVTRACLDRIAAANPIINAFCLVDEEGALSSASESEGRWLKGEPLSPIDGVPVSIKDLFLTKGWPTLCGSKVIDPKSRPWDEDSASVARLREAGTVFLGKTTTTEFGHKGVGDCPLTGITRNPWNLELTTGGSSCGAGAAGAARMAPLNLGSDGGGSIRIPASFCGLVGYKPGFGTVPARHSVITGPLVAEGPLTRSVEDAALMGDVLALADTLDINPLPVAREAGLTAGLGASIKGKRIGYLATIGDAPVDPDVAAAVRNALDIFRQAGAEVEEARLVLPDSERTYITILSAGTAMFLNEYSDEQRAMMEPALLTLGEIGGAISGVDYARAFQRTRIAYIQELRALFARYDMLVLPTMPLPAFPVMLDYPGEQDGGWHAAWTPFTFPFNLTSLPACSVPCGLTLSGLPIGLQVVGPWGADAAVLNFAAVAEAGYALPAPPLDNPNTGVTRR
ncbi:MAG: amidase [Rhizobium sp.]